MRPLNRQLKSVHRSCSSTRVGGANEPVTNGATEKVHTTSQRTVCLKIGPNLHRLPRAGSKNLEVCIRTSRVPELPPYDKKMRRTAVSKIGVTTMRADLDCR